jgi:hypothetical protein
MRKLKIMEHISLDGVIQVSDGPSDGDFPYGDWTAPYRTPAGLEKVLCRNPQAREPSMGPFRGRWTGPRGGRSQN